MKAFCFVLMLLTIASCSKYSFTDATFRDDSGSLFGDVDESDWNLDDSWTSKEKGLFDSTNDFGCDFIFYSDNYNSSYDPILAFPNPTQSWVNLFAKNDSLTTIEVVLVNRNFKVIEERNSSDTNSSFTFNLSGLNDGYYRIYYKIIKDNCEYRGHGDILKK